MRMCAECQGSMIGKRPQAVYCSRPCKTKASDRRRLVDGRALARDRARYESEAGRRQQYARDYHKRNPERVWQWRLVKRARRLGAPVFEVTARDWRRMVARFRGACAYCGVAGPLECDHIIPLSRGGAHSFGNILPACAGCNQAKRSRFVVEWRWRAT